MVTEADSADVEGELEFIKVETARAVVRTEGLHANQEFAAARRELNEAMQMILDRLHDQEQNAAIRPGAQWLLAELLRNWASLTVPPPANPSTPRLPLLTWSGRTI